ncbi:hypothetical protein ASB57_12140 [Bordetella sp. N]|nr:hypothetical protein ASB57_12140 [Bordetella sp. N]
MDTADNAGAKIARYAASYAEQRLPADALHAARRALLDTHACAIAGLREDAVRIATRYVEPLAVMVSATGTAKGAAKGMAKLWGQDRYLPAEAAAFCNGVAAHVLDYDDVMTPMRAHVSATLVPALAALAPSVDADMTRFAIAYVAGFEVMAKFARAMALPHYTKGWHSTSALGVLGTTVACGVLLGLDTSAQQHALGLAVAQASGTRQNFGAMAKSFQSAHCAAAAVRAAVLASLGMTAADDAIDGKYGYMSLYAAGEDLTSVLDTLGREPLEITAIGIDVKKYPCCYALHRGIDAMLALRAEHGLTPDQVDRVHVLTSTGGLQALITALPEDGLQAKFSMEYGMACALLDGSVGLASFTDDAMRRPAIQALMPRVSITEASGSILPRWSEITLTLRDGTEVRRRVVIARGDAGDPLSDAELVDKARGCYAYGGIAIDGTRHAQALLGLTNEPIEPWLNAI